MGTQTTKIRKSPNYLRRWVLQAGAVAPYAALALRKPLAGLFALSRAFKAQAFALVAALFLIYAAPAVVKSVSGFFIPQETKKAFGLIKHKKDRPVKGYLDTTLLGALWVGGVGGSLLLFWFALPAGLAAANSRGKKRYREGLLFSEENPALSRRKCRFALALVTDPEIAKAMSECESSAATIAPANSGSTVVARVDGELVSFSADDIPARDDSIGPNGRFTLKDELGRGSMGVVFDGFDSLLDRRVALKQLPVWLAGNIEYSERFRREAKALAKLNHQNIVQLYDLIEESGHLWMALEFVGAGDLSSRLKRIGPMTVSEAVKVTTKIAAALDCAHSAGIIHRDLKPANILLTEHSEPKVTDFGIAKLTQDPSMTQAGAVLGSPSYMSPEQAEGLVSDERSDIYALGITFYEMLTGAPPFTGATSEILIKHIGKPPVAPSTVVKDIPTEIETLILRMLAKDPAERPENMVAVVNELTSVTPGAYSRA